MIIKSLVGKRIIAGLTSFAMLLGSSPGVVKDVGVEGSDEEVIVNTEEAETTVYLGDGFAYDIVESRFYYTGDKSDGMNGYAASLDYEMEGEEVTGVPVLVTDPDVRKAVYYSYGAPGYKCNEALMNGLYQACYVEDDAEKAGISEILIAEAVRKA